MFDLYALTWVGVLVLLSVLAGEGLIVSQKKKKKKKKKGEGLISLA